MVGIFGILNGGHGAATKGAPTAASMPAFDWQLSDQQVADVASLSGAPGATPPRRSSVIPQKAAIKVPG
jgi:mono/diheme cytochrome c family protein